MSAPPPLRADGERVWVADATEADEAAYIAAHRVSSRRIAEWNPVDPFALPSLVRAASAYHRTLLIHAKTPQDDHGLVGKVNVTSIVRGRAESGTLGYDSFDPYAGQGLFTEGLGLVLDLAFTPGRAGLSLHRLEVNVQPGNVRSAMVLRRLGFRLEGHSPEYLRMPDASGREQWRDHDRYALLESEWRGTEHATTRRVVVLVNGVPGAGKTTLARRLAGELRVPLFSKDTVKEAVADGMGDQTRPASASGPRGLGAGASQALWSLLAESPVGGVVENWFWPQDMDHARDGLQRAGLEPGRIPEVWCDVPVAVARERFERRATDESRHPMHAWPVGDDAYWDRIEAAAHPMGLGPVLRIDTTGPVADREVVRTALLVRASPLTSGPTSAPPPALFG